MPSEMAGKVPRQRHVLCMKWGTKYGPDYVNRLYAMVRRHLTGDFSFVCLTTLGFGDLSPSVGLPQALTALEALLGSVFLVTLVARLVTLWVRQGEGPGD